jgi:hypothetical protein
MEDNQGLGVEKQINATTTYHPNILSNRHPWDPSMNNNAPMVDTRSCVQSFAAGTIMSGSIVFESIVSPKCKKK